MSSSLQTLIRDLHRRRGRERRGLALAEGIRLVEEALATAIAVRGAAVSPALEGTIRGKALKAALLEKGVRVEEVSDTELEELTEQLKAAERGGAGGGAADAAWRDIERAGGTRPETDLADELLKGSMDRAAQEAQADAQLRELKKKMGK